MPPPEEDVAAAAPDPSRCCWADVQALLTYRPDKDETNFVIRNCCRMRDEALIAVAGCMLQSALRAIEHQSKTDWELTFHGTYLDDEGARVLCARRARAA